MIVFAASLFAGVFLAEISIRFFCMDWFQEQVQRLRHFFSDFRNAADDDQRQSMLLSSGWQTLQFSLWMLLCLVGLGGIAFVAPWVFSWSQLQYQLYFLAVSVVATIWWLLRRRLCNDTLSLGDSKSAAGAYGRLERWLHWIALNSAVVRHLSFDLERMYALPKRRERSIHGAENGAVYICGLARSGTTMLLHLLDEIDDFRSLTYRDMPFVLAPNLWGLFTRYFPRPSVPEERAHGDGIHVHFDSPEGFEEVFWRTYNPSSSKSRCFDVEEPNKEALDAFEDYRAIVAQSRAGAAKRYLSKNNNNLLRLKSIASDPASTVLLVYRNPVATARSLHRQHLRFCASQAEDRFSRSYMGWLAHHEFGLDHLPFCFAQPYMDATLVPEDLNYWLDYWNAVYSHVLLHSELRFNLINHDVLCAEPEEMLGALFGVLGVEADIGRFARRISESRIESSEGFSPELLKRAQETYRALLDSPKNIYK